MSAPELIPDGGPVGARIEGLDLRRPIAADDLAFVQAAIDEHAVVAIKDQELSPAEQVAFGRNFGRLQINVRAEANNEETPEIFWVSNITQNGKPVGSHDAGRYWHSDLCYLPKPTYLTLLHAIEVPHEAGKRFGDTLFASAAAAFEALTPEMKERLQGLSAANSYRTMWNRKAHEFGAREVLSKSKLAKLPEDSVHPIVRTHPRNGRKCLFVCDGYSCAIPELSEHESRTLLADLFEHLGQDCFIYRHQWDTGDLLIWDNCAVQHKAVFDYGPELRRLMQRCTVEGDAPI